MSREVTGKDIFVVRPRIFQRIVGCAICVFILFAVVWVVQQSRTGEAGGAEGVQALPRFNLADPAEVRKWETRHDIRQVEATPEGMRIVLEGADPYILGPIRDFPRGLPLRVRLRVRSEREGTWQLFFFDKAASERDSVRFGTAPGTWQEVAVSLPPLSSGFRFRIDPPGTSGTCIVASITCEPRLVFTPPSWQRPTLPAETDAILPVTSGDLALRHSSNEWGGFVVRVRGELVGSGFNRPLIGYLHGSEPCWLDIAEKAMVSIRNEGGSIVAEATLTDADGATWELRQRFEPGEPGSIDVRTEIRVDADRSVFFIPVFLLTPGLGAAGPIKTQALMAGVEYLDNEPSSSTADVEGPSALRRVPDSAKLTFPLMAVQTHDRYIGLVWEPAASVCGLFDSPDRVFQSGAHVMGLIAPGANGDNRPDGELLPHEPIVVGPSVPVRAQATLIGGMGSSVVPAMRQYVSLRGLPPRPSTWDSESYARTASLSWLDTPIRERNQFRHAVAGSTFAPQPAADAAWMMEWLAARTGDQPLAGRLRAAATETIAAISPTQWYHAAVGHLRFPVAPLVYGHVPESLEQAQQVGRSLLGRFEPDGSVRYRAAAGGTDFGRTHFSAEASGLAGAVVAQLLDAAVYSGDPRLIAEGLRVLRRLERFADGVPRGAQTWEIPLHTPDILAAAYLVRAFTLGYELTGDPDLLESARYWAWTGVPFVYLVNPTGQMVGPYATTPVFGATHWTAPNWIGLPVQWCGLVYADAIGRLAPHDPAGPWMELAGGIVVSGIQQTYPPDHPHRGLLPDSFNLRSQSRNPADINPGTLQPLALELLANTRPYDFRALRANGLLAHAPGRLRDVRDEAGKVLFAVESWSPKPYYVVVHGFRQPPSVRVDGTEVRFNGDHQFLPDRGTAILRLTGPSIVEIVVEQ